MPRTFRLVGDVLGGCKVRVKRSVDERGRPRPSEGDDGDEGRRGVAFGVGEVGERVLEGEGAVLVTMRRGWERGDGVRIRSVGTDTIVLWMTVADGFSGEWSTGRRDAGAYAVRGDSEVTSVDDSLVSFARRVFPSCDLDLVRDWAERFRKFVN